MSDVTEGFIPVAGGKVWYRKSGDGPGVPLLVLHGGPGSMSLDSDPLRDLGEERPVYHYDQLGCGRSDKPDDTSLWTVERYIEELEQVIHALDLREVHILGHSWGTMLLAAYLLKQPRPVVRTAIFSSPALSAKLWERDQREYLKAFPQEVRDIVERCEADGTTNASAYQQAMISFYERHVCRILPWPDDFAKAMKESNEEIYGRMWGASEFTVTGTLKEFDVTDRLNEVELPTLFLCGLFDEATPKTTEYYASLVSKSEFHVLDGCSHMTYVEDPDTFKHVVQSFLRRH